MELTQRLLEQFLVVASEGNIGRAAHRLSMTQPPLTQAMQRLERAIGVKLFDRTAHGIELTAAGRSFRDDAERLSGAQGAAVRRTQRVAAGLRGVVDIGFVISMAFQFVPDLLRSSAVALPELTLHLTQMRSLQLFDGVRCGRLDLGFARGPVHGADELVVSEVSRENPVLAVPVEHPLAGRSAVTLTDLRGEPLVLPSPQTLAGVSAQIHAGLRKAGVAPRIVAQTDELSGMMAYPIAGLAVAVVPEQVVAMRHPKVVYVPIADDSRSLVTSIVAVHRRQADAAVTRLLDLVATTVGKRTEHTN